MLVTVPDLVASSCRCLTLCTDATNLDRAHFPSYGWDKKWPVFSVPQGDSQVWVRIGLGKLDGECPNHVHIDLGTPEFLADKEFDVVDDENEVQRLLQPLVGLNLQGHLCASLIRPTNTAPALIKLFRHSTPLADGASCWMNSGRFKFEGSAVQGIGWNFHETLENIEYSIDIEHSLTITPGFLGESLEVARNGLAQFLKLGTVAD